MVFHMSLFAFALAMQTITLNSLSKVLVGLGEFTFFEFLDKLSFMSCFWNFSAPKIGNPITLKIAGLRKRSHMTITFGQALYSSLI